MAESNVQAIYKDVYQLKAEITQISNILTKLDNTIDKLTEVSTNISQLLAIQTNRLETQEKISEKLSKELDDNDKLIRQEIARLEKDLREELEDQYDEILKEIKSMKESNHKQHETLNSKLAIVEKWIWLVSGGAAVVGFILSKLTSKLF